MKRFIARLLTAGAMMMVTLVSVTPGASAACELGAKRSDERGGKCVWNYVCMMKSKGDTEGDWVLFSKDNCPAFDGAKCGNLGELKKLSKGKCRVTYACALHADGPKWIAVEDSGCD
jgi:hypothetical protein